jgi:hypothetical protein
VIVGLEQGDAEIGDIPGFELLCGPWCNQCCPTAIAGVG